MDKLRFICPCLFGLEGIAAGEARRLDLENVTATDGRITFEGDLYSMARANLGLRCVERVLIHIKSFKATSFDELFEGTKAAPFEQFIAKDSAFPVKGWSINSALHSIPDCQSIIKKAIVERLKSKYHVNWLEETGSTLQIQFSILKDEVTLMLDTSGQGLHKRGYRKVATEAPIKETLAAGMVDLARVKAYSKVYDPFCGSGTLLIESAMKALNIAPGLKTRFAAERLPFVPSEVFATERKRALESVRPADGLELFGYDIDEQAIEIAKQNAKNAGVLKHIHFSVRDIAEQNFKETQGILLTNPPYGERLLDLNNARKLYQALGNACKDSPLSCYIITPEEDFEKYFGRKPSKDRKLYNGMIKCRLYMYY